MTTSYTYDTIGNIKSVTKNNKTSLYVYDEDGLNFLTAIKDKDSGKDKVTYEYDADGNMIKENDVEHEKVTLNSYDEEGQLIKTAITDGKTQTTMTTTNRYNGDGERIEKDVNGEKTYYYVVNDAVLYTYKVTSDEKGNEVRTITSQNVVAPDGSIISSKRNEGYYIYNLDLKGSTVSVAAPDGSYQLVYAYDIYGEPVKRGDKDFYNEITFTGAVYDESTGLFYLSSRYYDPTTGRFISMDSYRGELDDPLSLNLYAYCQGNPIKYVDRDGNMPTILSAMCIGFLSGAGVELVDQIISGEKINWEKVLVKGGTSAIGSMVGVKYIVAGALLTNVLDQKVDSRGQSDRRLSISSLAKSGTKAGASKYINNKITNAEKAYKKAKVKPGKKTKGSKKKKNKSKKLSKQHKDIKKVKKVQKVRKNPVYKSITHGIKKVYNKFVKKPVAKVKKRISSIRISKKSVLGKTINKVKKVFRRWFKW
ncbi:RHS repeat-associated core domain-containing protein [Anaerofustis sp.]|uniref:RHS repeat domain-containing protein n=1 Tax=Anaerofustis sp. TaxID=1872517 RepID=UPI0025C04903|nr:RHS repeat-associated core domain-containing protein [Anaerofustis sp.]